MTLFGKEPAWIFTAIAASIIAILKIWHPVSTDVENAITTLVPLIGLFILRFFVSSPNTVATLKAQISGNTNAGTSSTTGSQ